MRNEYVGEMNIYTLPYKDMEPRPDDMNFLEGVTSRHRHSNSTPNSDKFRYSADTVPTLLDMRFILSVLVYVLDITSVIND